MKFEPFTLAVAGGLLLLYLMLYFLLTNRQKMRAAIKFPDLNHLGEMKASWRVKIRWLPGFLRLLSLVLFLIAFARPQQGLEVVHTARQGIAIQMVIDRSSSMTQPMTFQGKELDRLDVVKKVFAEFINGDGQELNGRPNDMIGLNSFAGFVEENSPLTLDHKTLVNFAQTLTPASRTEDGTMIGDAIYYSVLRLISVDELLRKAAEKNNDYQVKSKIIILLTDGQQTRGGRSPEEAARFAAENGIKIYTIAITSDQNYTRRDSLFGQFFSLMGQKLDTTILENVAALTGGTFAKASSGESLLKIYQQIDQLEKSEFEERFTTYKEVFPLFVTLGFSILLLELVLSKTLLRRIP